MDQKHLGWLLEKLQSPDEVYRWSAVQRLAHMQAKEGVHPLLSCLNDSNFTVRLYTASALGRLGNESALEPLITCVQNEQESDDVRAAAASSLGDLGDRRVVEPLITCLQPPGEYLCLTQASAAQALGRLADRRAVEPLITCLPWALYPWGDVSRQAALALGHLADRRAVEPLIAYFQETIYVQDRHEAALVALAELGEGDKVVDLLLSELHEPPATFRSRVWIVKQLARWGDGRTLGVLPAYLQDPDPLLRMWVALGLDAIRERLKEQGKVGDQQEADVRQHIEEAQVGESLVAALDQWLTSVQVGFIPALKELEDLKRFDWARITDLLLSHLNDSRLHIQEQAGWALALLGDTRAVEPLIACLRQEQAIGERQIIMGALARLGDARAFEPLLTCLSQAMRTHKQMEAESAMQALGQLGQAGAVEPLIAALTTTWDGPQRPVGVAALQALGMFKDPRAIEAVCTQLQNPSPEMRGAAAEALQQGGDDRAVEPLLNRLHDPPVSVAVVRALGQIRAIRAIDPLRVYLHSLDTEGISPSGGMHLAIRQALFELEWEALGS